MVPFRVQVRVTVLALSAGNHLVPEPDSLGLLRPATLADHAGSLARHLPCRGQRRQQVRVEEGLQNDGVHSIVADQPVASTRVHPFWERVKQGKEYEEIVADPDQVGFGIGVLRHT